MRKFKPNEIILRDDYAEIIIKSKKYGITFLTMIDKEDIEKVEKEMWHIAYAPTVKNFYVKSNKKGFLHRYIMNVSNDLVVDHINHNTLDNRRNNLRCISNMQNTQNKKSISGVNFENKRKMWRARIGVNYSRIELGFYNTYDEAVKARLEAEKVYYNK